MGKKRKKKKSSAKQGRSLAKVKIRIRDFLFFFSFFFFLFSLAHFFGYLLISSHRVAPPRSAIDPESQNKGETERKKSKSSLPFFLAGLRPANAPLIFVFTS